MKALTFPATEQVRYVTDAVDPIIERPSDVIVQVHLAGICGSDLHQYHGREPVHEDTIPGHELVGEVVACGPDVQRWSVGDLVYSPFTTSCGHCFFCESGLSARCDESQVYGYLPPGDTANRLDFLQGAQAELVRVPLADTTLRPVLNADNPYQSLLLGDNFTTGYYCAHLGAISPGHLTVVLGCGAVGLSAIQAARYFGAEQIIAVDGVASRRRRAETLGAVTTSPDEAAAIVQSVAAQRRKRGADNILEAVGSPAAQQLAFQLARPGGVIAAVGMHTSDHFAFSPAEAYDKNLTYRAGRCPVRSLLDHIEHAVSSGDLIVPTDLIVTHSDIELSSGADAYRQFSRREDDCVKIVLAPGS